MNLCRHRKTISVGEGNAGRTAVVAAWVRRTAALGRRVDAAARGRGDEAARVLELAGAWQVMTDYSGEAGARATRSLLSAAAPDRPTAIVYDNVPAQSSDVVGDES
jgi:hypothetical protein